MRRNLDSSWIGGFSLGIDLGLSRTGLAISKGFSVRPLKVLELRGQKLEMSLIEIAQQQEVDEFIVGLPVSSDGKETPQSNKVRSVAGRIAIRAAERGWRVYLQDEHGTSTDAMNRGGGCCCEVGDRGSRMCASGSGCVNDVRGGPSFGGFTVFGTGKVVIGASSDGPLKPRIREQTSLKTMLQVVVGNLFGVCGPLLKRHGGRHGGRHSFLFLTPLNRMSAKLPICFAWKFSFGDGREANGPGGNVHCGGGKVGVRVGLETNCLGKVDFGVGNGGVGFWFCGSGGFEGLSKSARKQSLDAYAAMMVLERYFSEHGKGTEMVLPKQLDLQEKLRKGPSSDDLDFF
ncbi:hypothetical protein M8C21_019043 [Ambrosia artemisiifolia]|uniref:YqgF/RNase H-like domain-containing protein n=1 Tax=Ambrosia artemisiifolia TaxID=4212 RepID=A0AAD5BZ42_AMBAR|nr:hypothetical protein M8C21_019043 [Ambrosia artemisiifolia]